MRAAFVSRNTLFTGRGGDTIQILKTASHLEKLGVKVDIYTSSQKINYNDYDVLHGFNVIRPADLISHFAGFRGLKVLSTIYVDYSEYEKKARGGISGKLFGFIGRDRTEYLKTIFRRIRNGEKSFNASYLIRGHRSTLKSLLMNSHVLLPNSESEYRRLVRDYGIERPYEVIPNAIETSLFGNGADLRMKENDLVICVARIDAIKNQLNLIRALNNTRYRLMLIGKPAPNHVAYYDQCRSEAGENVFFYDQMSQEELIGFYGRARVHAMPSWFETTGLSSLEAAAMNCSLVVSDKGDVREYFGSEAFYAEPDNIKSIFEAVDAAARAGGFKNLSDRIRTSYTWDIAAERTLDVYKRYINRAQL